MIHKEFIAAILNWLALTSAFLILFLRFKPKTINPHKLRHCVKKDAIICKRLCLQTAAPQSAPEPVCQHPSCVSQSDEPRPVCVCRCLAPCVCAGKQPSLLRIHLSHPIMTRSPATDEPAHLTIIPHGAFHLKCFRIRINIHLEKTIKMIR